MCSAGLITGKSGDKFCPKDLTDRAEAVILINRIMLDSSYKAKDNKFKDLRATDWYYTEVLKAIME